MLVLRSSAATSLQCQRLLVRISNTSARNSERISNQKYTTTSWNNYKSTINNINPNVTIGSSSSNNISINKRTLFIQTESTPNPESLKFYPGEPVLSKPSNNNEEQEDEVTNGFYATHKDKEEISRSPLAKELFKIEGVKGVYLGGDFITITKFATSHWQHIRPYIFSSIMDFYSTGKPVLLSSPEITDTTILDDDDEIVAMIKEILEVKIRPAVQEDGGDIHYDGFDYDTGIVTVKLAGACSGCPSSSATLKNGVENMLMHYIPEVTAVEALDEEEDEEGDGDSGGGDNDGNVNVTESKKLKSYEERLAAAGIPFSD